MARGLLLAYYEIASPILRAMNSIILPGKRFEQISFLLGCHMVPFQPTNDANLTFCKPIRWLAENMLTKKCGSIGSTDVL